MTSGWVWRFSDLTASREEPGPFPWVKRAPMGDDLEADKRRAVEEGGRGDACSVCGVAASMVPLRRTWEGLGTPRNGRR